MSETTPPDPIPHLIAAVTALGFAVRDLHELQDPGNKASALRQDCAEHSDEAADLLHLIRDLLGASNEGASS